MLEQQSVIQKDSEGCSQSKWSILVVLFQFSIYLVDAFFNQTFNSFYILAVIVLLILAEMISWFKFYEDTIQTHVKLTILWHLLISFNFIFAALTLNHSGIPQKVTWYYFIIRIPILINQFVSILSTIKMLMIPNIGDSEQFARYARWQTESIGFVLYGILIGSGCDYLAFGRDINLDLLITCLSVLIPLNALRFLQNIEVLPHLHKLLVSE